MGIADFAGRCMQITECITSDSASVQGISNNTELNVFSYSIEVTRAIKSGSKFNFLVPNTLLGCIINEKVKLDGIV